MAFIVGGRRPAAQVWGEPDAPRLRASKPSPHLSPASLAHLVAGLLDMPTLLLATDTADDADLERFPGRRAPGATAVGGWLTAPSAHG